MLGVSRSGVPKLDFMIPKLESYLNGYIDLKLAKEGKRLLYIISRYFYSYSEYSILFTKIICMLIHYW